MKMKKTGADNVSQTKLWCLCHQPHLNRFMIMCDTCEDWYHGSCVGITKKKAAQMNEWICSGCFKMNRVVVEPLKHFLSDNLLSKHNNEQLQLKLIQENEVLVKENNVQKKANEALKMENDLLEMTNKALEEEKSALKEDYEMLKEEIKELKKDNDVVKKKNKELEKDNDSLITENKELKSANHGPMKTESKLLKVATDKAALKENPKKRKCLSLKKREIVSLSQPVSSLNHDSSFSDDEFQARKPKRFH